MRFASLIAMSFTFAVCAQASAASAATSPSDRHFLRDAIQGDLSEIMLGKLAERRGASRGVRQYGAILASDHAAALAAARTVARRMNVTAPGQPKAEALQEYRKLQRLHGRRFDAEFASYMVDDHRKDVAEFKDEAGQRGAVSSLAANTLPVLRKHLRIAQSLDHAH